MWRVVEKSINDHRLTFTCLFSFAPQLITTDLQTDFLLRIKFNETFTGLIQTDKGDPNCVYVNATIQRGTDYEVKVRKEVIC